MVLPTPRLSGARPGERESSPAASPHSSNLNQLTPHLAAEGTACWRHPAWPAMPWWSLLTRAYALARGRCPSATATLTRRKTARPWPMRASVLLFGSTDQNRRSRYVCRHRVTAEVAAKVLILRSWVICHWRGLGCLGTLPEQGWTILLLVLDVM